MASSKIYILIFLLGLLTGCGELGEQLGLSEKKKSKTPISCYGIFYDPVEDIYRNWQGPVSCQEDINSLQYRVYWNQCSGGDELVGFNTDSQNRKQYCSNSPCDMEDRKRGYKVYPNGQITIECGFSTPGYIQDFYRGQNTGYQYQAPTGQNYRPYGGNAYGGNPYGRNQGYRGYNSNPYYGYRGY